MSESEAVAEKDDVTPSAPNRRGHHFLRDKLVGQRVGRYDVLHRIASGGMGSVYVGRARGAGDFERLVAIKVLHEHLAHQEDFVGMFLDEARLAAQIRHPNVVGTVDVCPTDEGYFIVMDYVEGDHLGGLLRAALRKGELLPVPVVLRILMDSLMGLAAAHGLKDRSGTPLNLVHRDISPQNVLVGVDGLARLTDFGVAKAEHRISSTREGQFKGKLAYASPEQAATGEVEQRSDLFSMGVVLWEALTAKRLFSADTNQATLRRLLEDPIPALSLVRPELAALDAFMAKALARPLDERFQSAQEMAEAIEVVAADMGGLGTTRAVAQAVRQLAKEKLDAEHDAIQQAIEERRRQSARPPAAAVETSPEADTVRPPGLGQRPGSRRRTGLVLAAAAALAVAITWIAWSAMHDDEPEVATTPAVEEPAPEEPTPDEPAVDEAEPPAVDTDTEEEVERAAGDTETSAMEEEPPPEPSRGERRERARRLRAARRRAARDRETATMETAMTASSMDETDILVNPYRNQ